MMLSAAPITQRMNFVAAAVEMLHEHEQWLADHRADIDEKVEHGFAQAERGELIDGEEAFHDLRQTSSVNIALTTIQNQGGRVVSPSIEKLAPEAGTIFVVGYVTWDPTLSPALNIAATRDCSDLRLFDLDAFLTQEAVEAAFPGLAPVTRSPVLGKFVDGLLSWKKEGPEVLDWLSTPARELGSR